MIWTEGVDGLGAFALGFGLLCALLAEVLACAPGCDCSRGRLLLSLPVVTNVASTVPVGVSAGLGGFFTGGFRFGLGGATPEGPGFIDLKAFSNGVADAFRSCVSNAPSARWWARYTMGGDF